MWEKRIEQTKEMRRQQELGGGEARIERQHEKGKMTALERITYLLDEDSFHPVDSFFQTREDSASLLKGKTYLGDGVVTGWGTIHGRRVCVAAEDFTVIGGTLGEIHAQKICAVQDLSYDMKIPMILLNDSGGARIEEGILSLSGYGGMFQRHVRSSGVVPQIAAILGPCSGGACYSPALCDFVFIVRDLSKMCLTGPAVVESVLGMKTTLEELGGTEVHGRRSGVAQVVCQDERSCLDSIRTLLTYLPQNSSPEASAQLLRLHGRNKEPGMGPEGRFRQPEGLGGGEFLETGYDRPGSGKRSGGRYASPEGAPHSRPEAAGKSGGLQSWLSTVLKNGGSALQAENGGAAEADSRALLEGRCHTIWEILGRQHTPIASRPFQEIVPDNSRRVYDVHEVIYNILRNDSFYEIHRDFAPNAVVGFGIFDGKVLGIVANQPNYMGGSIDYHAADKMARFIRFCDCFNIPLLTLVDVPAFFPGPEQEQNGIIRHGAKILYAYSEATVPKVTLILRKAYGGAFIAMNCRMMGADLVFAWPIAEIAVMGAEGAVRVINRRQIESAQDPVREYERLKQEYEDQFSNPFLAAKKGYVDEIILPEETVERLTEAFRLLETKKQEGPSHKKHGNIPL